ncbi:MAG: type II and III secretion system protein family protein [Proteobacteria bacterium]|nr:type II and III secretion system protein family protein [Pseudomonadota bacterium]
MRFNLAFSWRAAMRALALCIGVGLMSSSVSAQSPGSASDGYADDGSTPFTHQSFIRIQDNGGPIRKSIKIGQGKSVLLEFPRDVRDVMVSNPAVIDAVVLSSRRVFLLSKGGVGEANAFFFDTSGHQFATMELYVERETAGLQSLLNRIIPGSSIKVEMLNQTVILTGTVKSPIDSTRAGDIAAQFISQQLTSLSVDTKEGVTLAQGGTNQLKDSVINMLTVEAEEQVLLKVTVAEVERTALKQLGVNLGAMVQSGSFSTALLTANAFPISSAQGLGTLPTVGIATSGASGCTAGLLCTFNSGPSAGSFGNSGLTSQWGNGPNAVQSAIRALERDGLIRTLAEPNLTAISGEPAEFLAGGEVPYVTGIDTQSGVSSVAFKKFGVQLSFTPVVLSEGRISLKIDTSVSDISQFIANNPVFDTRQAKTVVELPSGGSLALAGLISTKTQQNIDGFPGAKDIPILGTLFRSRDFQNQESELVVIVTPYVVQPTSRQQLATPADGLAPATDLKADFLGHLNRIYGRGDGMPSGGLKGDYGFIVE